MFCCLFSHFLSLSFKKINKKLIERDLTLGGFKEKSKFPMEK